MKQNLFTEAELAHLRQSYRKKQQLTQGQLGQRAGISQERYSILKNNPDRITFDRLLRLMSALGLELVVQEKGDGPLTRSRSEVEW